MVSKSTIAFNFTFFAESLIEFEKMWNIDSMKHGSMIYWTDTILSH